jgi:hypothetical protein
MVCDSNILIYAAEPGDTLCLPYVEIRSTRCNWSSCVRCG